MLQAFIVSTLASWATALGGVPFLFFRRLPHRVYDGLLGMSAGIMLSVAGAALIEPALRSGMPSQAIGGLFVGVLFMAAVERYLPHLEPHFSGKAFTPTLRRGVLVFIAQTIHNFPEGFSTGVGYFSLPRGQGIALAVAIGVQNIPEGLSTALTLWRSGIGGGRTFLLTWGTSIAEPLAALLGIYLVAEIRSVLPWALGFAGGAMIYVSLLHLLPESYGHHNEREATIGVIAGLLLTFLLEFSFSA